MIKNALYKVIKIRRPEDLGEKIVCQGGTFIMRRCYEPLKNQRQGSRAAVNCWLDGAYGAALIALENYEIGEVTALLSSDELSQFTAEKEFTHCGLCENNCMLTVTLFSDGRKFITGNRCEGARIKIKKKSAR